MPTDLEIIEELEKEIGKGLKQVDFEKVTEVTNSKGYAIDEHDNIIGLNLCSLDVTTHPCVNPIEPTEGINGDPLNAS